MSHLPAVRARGALGGTTFSLILAVALLAGVMPASAGAQDVDPRIGLGAGWLNAEEAISGLEALAHLDRPAGFFNPANIGTLSLANSDLAFRDNWAFVGSFHGFNIYNVSDPAAPVLQTSVVCPGGQGDLSVYGNLLFMSVEETRGRVDCGTQGNAGGA